MDERVTYAGYLALDDLLAAQHPRSGEPDEQLFIIIHQTKELWLKQMIAELSLAIADVRADRLTPPIRRWRGCRASRR